MLKAPSGGKAALLTVSSWPSSRGARSDLADYGKTSCSPVNLLTLAGPVLISVRSLEKRFSHSAQNSESFQLLKSQSW
jgi:hypothetical protein